MIALNKQIFAGLAACVAVVGCATPPIPPMPESRRTLAGPETINPAELQLETRPESQETYVHIDDGPCVKRDWRGYISDTYRSGFKKNADGRYSLKVKPNRLITVAYSVRNAREICTAAGAFWAEGGKTYLVRGNSIFTDSLLPTFTGCKVEVFDSVTKARIPTIPKRREYIQPSRCDPDEDIQPEPIQ